MALEQNLFGKGHSLSLPPSLRVRRGHWAQQAHTTGTRPWGRQGFPGDKLLKIGPGNVCVFLTQPGLGEGQAGLEPGGEPLWSLGSAVVLERRLTAQGTCVQEPQGRTSQPAALGGDSLTPVHRSGGQGGVLGVASGERPEHVPQSSEGAPGNRTFLVGAGGPCHGFLRGQWGPALPLP